MTPNQEQLTAEEAEARARKLKIEYEMELAAAQRDAIKLRRIPKENEIIDAEQQAVRLRRRQEEVARFRASLAEVSVLAAAAAAAVGSIGGRTLPTRNWFSFAALAFLLTSLSSLIPYTLAVSRRKPKCEHFGISDWAALAFFLAGITVIIVTLMCQ